MYLFIFIFCIIIATVRPQYYYVPQPSFYHVSLPTYNAFSPFSTYHMSPHFQYTTSATQRTVFTANNVHKSALAQNNVQSAGLTQNGAPRKAFTQSGVDYRGFAYQTRTDNGATSHVFFAMGPQAQKVNSRIFKNFNSHALEENTVANNARTVASEMIDPFDKKEDKQNILPKNIQDLYSPPQTGDPVKFFQSFFELNQPGAHVINFYSRNNYLITEPVAGYPANVIPLQRNGITPRLLNLVSKNDTEVNTEKNNNKTEIEEVAESIISNTRFRINVVDEFINENDNYNYNLNSKSESTTDSAIRLTTTKESVNNLNISELSSTTQEPFSSKSSEESSSENFFTSLSKSAESTILSEDASTTTEIFTEVSTTKMTESSFVTLSEVVARLRLKENNDFEQKSITVTSITNAAADVTTSKYKNNTNLFQEETTAKSEESFMIIVGDDDDATTENTTTTELTQNNTEENILITTDAAAIGQ